MIDWSLLNPRRANLAGLSNDYYRDFENNAIARNNWVAKVLADLPQGARILDAGAGEQQYRPLCSHLRYVSQDFAQYDGKGDNVGLQQGSWDHKQLDIVGDITNISEPDQSFDAIMCTEVLEHLPEPLAAIQEFSRLLRKGGHLIITAPFCSLTHFAPYHFYSGYNRYFFTQHLPSLGFEILELQANGNYFAYLAQEIHRVVGVAEQYCQRKPHRLEMLALRLIMPMLKRFSDSDTKSSELLSFGYHVLAIKK